MTHGGARSRRRRRISAVSGIAVAALALSTQALGGGTIARSARDTGFYPISAHVPPDKPDPVLFFEKVSETVVPGLPEGDPLSAAPDGRTLIVRTSAGTVELPAPSGAAASGELRPIGSGPRARRMPPTGPETAGPACTWPGDRPPRWMERIRARQPHLEHPFRCLQGPDDTVALVGADGTLSGRDSRHGHLLWRQVASHRVSRPGSTYGAYLLIAADASRSLEAFRWVDGTGAGVFQLDSEDAYLASAPVEAGGRIHVLCVQPPRQESRLLTLAVLITPPRPPGGQRQREGGAEAPPSLDH